MASKGKKGKKSLPKKQASGTIFSGPDFPQQLRDWRIRNISWGGYGVSKSWRSVSKQCNSKGNAPQLQLSCANHNRIQIQEHGKSQPHLKIPFLPPGFYTSGCEPMAVWTPFGPYRDWSVIPGFFASISTSFTPGLIYIPPGGIMALTGLARPALLFLRPPHETTVQVIELDCTLVDPYDSEKQSIIFTNAIGFKGKFYALSLHGALAVVEEEDSSFTITGFGKNRAVPSVPSRRFIEYLVESNGEILLVFLISRKSISMIDYVEVLKLDLVTLSWTKMDNLGDRALFLAGTNRCLSVSANQVAYKSNQVGYKSNRVYFTHQAIYCWKEFDMESKIISPCCNF